MEYDRQSNRFFCLKNVYSYENWNTAATYICVIGDEVTNPYSK